MGTVPADDTVSQQETLKERLQFLLGSTLRSIPAWPPDMFGVCASILHSSGAYAAVVDDEQSFLEGLKSSERAKDIARIGTEWRQNYVTTSHIPLELRAWWDLIISEQDLAITEIAKSNRCTGALLNLLAAADEACRGVGVYISEPKEDASPEEKNNSSFLSLTEVRLLLSAYEEGATLCQQIHPSRGRVLPRMHTPQSGLTVRSLSHHLSFCLPSDIRPEWKVSIEKSDPGHSFNLLIIPWPKIITPLQFRASKSVGIADSVNPGGYGLFTYDLSAGPSVDHVKELLGLAEARIGPIHGVLFPELSMSEGEYSRIADAIVAEDRFLVAGVGESAKSETECGSNRALWDVAARAEEGQIVKGRFVQRKHHRWKLTKSQIVQYGIGGSLHPDANWWEHISLEKRTLAFLNLRLWLTCTVLICEDLARPDPVGDLLRAVGPNLVIALLSDGPQTLSRWPGRYAGALADDPGSSVLTITSAGMARLSRPRDGANDRSKVIALWRDPIVGSKEIEIQQDTDAVVLNLTVEYAEEWTADGRGDGKSSGYPVLSGYHLIKSEALPR